MCLFNISHSAPVLFLRISIHSLQLLFDTEGKRRIKIGRERETEHAVYTDGNALHAFYFRKVAGKSVKFIFFVRSINANNYSLSIKHLNNKEIGYRNSTKIINTKIIWYSETIPEKN